MYPVAAAAIVIIPGIASPASAAPGAAGARAATQALAPPTVFGWGSDFLGALGIGSRNDQRAAPTPIPLPAGVRQISAGRNAWSSAAVLANGTVATWGANTEGQLGDGTTTERDTPGLVPGLTGIVQVAAGAHTLALDSSGEVWAWGEDYSGELGNGTHNQPPGAFPSPALVPGLTGVTSVAIGDGFSLALRSDGTVWAWGWNREGELGDGTTVNKDRPEQVPGLSGITAVVAGDSTSYAVRADGSVSAWGNNANGLLGNGTNGGFSATPVQVPGLTGVTQIASDARSTLAVSGTAGTVWAWGDNTYGELGDGTTAAHYTPEQIGLAGVRQVAASDLANVALRSNGSVLTWGDNDHGELGTGTADTSVHPSPVLVRTLAGVSQISASLTYVLAIGSRSPQIPSLIGDTQATATQELQAAGYVLGRVAIVVDLTCEYIGVVKTQSPAAGTYDPPGTSVSIAIGKAGGKCL